jgi:hypothetical protein
VAFFLVFLTFALTWALNIMGMSIQIIEKLIVYEQYATFLIYNWLPVANPIVSIWINRPYRDAVKKLVASLSKKHTAVTPVQPLNQ